MVKIFKGVPYTGTLPAVLTGTKAGYLHRYKIYGNLSQSGTPTPSDPIVPSECGERTGNLFDGELLRGFYQTINDLSGNLNIYRSFRIQGLPAGTYTVAWAIPVRLVRVWRDNTLYENVAENITSYTVNTSNGDIAFSFRDERPNVYWDDSTQVMLNLGSTPLPYEPYGYKLPLLSGSTPVDIYIGDDTLSAEEYVDSGTGKIYRMVDGTLTPVDPPILFPQIPTSAGSTTISWAGQGLAPSEFDSIAEWVSATPKIYTNGAWTDAQTYTYDDGTWVADN